jgi:hypothetical protein
MFALTCIAREEGVDQIIQQQNKRGFVPFYCSMHYMLSHSFSISNLDFHTSKQFYINETHTPISKLISFSNVTMSDFDLYILEKYIFIPLLVLHILIQWGPDLQCSTYQVLPVKTCLL